MGLNHEKYGGQNSRDTLPLNPSSMNDGPENQPLIFTLRGSKKQITEIFKTATSRTVKKKKKKKISSAKTVGEIRVCLRIVLIFLYKERSSHSSNFEADGHKLQITAKDVIK